MGFYREIYEKGAHEGMQQGVQQGVERGKEEVVRNMLLNQCSERLICDVTDFGVAEVRRIRDKIQSEDGD